MQKRRLLRALLGTALGAVLFAGCSSGASSSAKSSASSKEVAPLYSSLPSSVRTTGHIVAGSELSVPPMIFYESNGTTISGVNYDLGQAMSHYLGVPILWRQLSFPDLEPALSSGQIQMIFDVINDTPQREKVFNFIDYVHAGNALLVPHGNPLHVTSLASLCGHSVATVRGAVQIQLVDAASSTCVSEGKGAITLRLYPSAPTARLQVQTGTVNAFIGNTPVLLYLARVSGGGKVFSAIPLAGHASYYGIAVSKSDQKLENALKKALEDVISSGAYMKILDKYGLSSIAISKPIINAAG
ncbi:MAG: ABC transporter substrate-binding protein [Actinobacteria bacterium]|nr:ABC transporter substrate-binding protein [Actinomycetota bacterium]MCL6096013.1 ABC transporter substrate-binding protein [Actinomycetota bacterium]